MIKIALIGANGRMGTQITQIITRKSDYYVLAGSIADSDVVIDFSSPELSLLKLQECVAHKKPLVIGTTGFNANQKNIVEEASKNIPVLLSPNMSLSVNILFKLTEIAANKLATFEAEIVEAHHRYKKDAPSGTAVKLGEVVAEARNLDFATHAKFTRHGVDEQRKPNDIGFAVVRGGDIVGKHDVMFIDDGEILTLTSEINNRSSFANGAVIAAAYLSQQQPGLYNMFDVLGL